jgi:hypothetical protein
MQTRNPKQPFFSFAAGYIESLMLSSTAYLWDPADMGVVTGVVGAIRTGLSAIATSMYSSVLTTESAKYIPKRSRLQRSPQVFHKPPSLLSSRPSR